jgi:hypothetical protein
MVGDRSPSITETITIDGIPVDLTGSTVQFKMRPVGSTTLKVNSPATVVTPAAGTVRYDWAAVDVDTADQYVVWWDVTTGGKVQSVGEAVIEFRAHGPFSAQALCTRADVARLIPGYSDDESTDGVLEDLIAAESQTWLTQTGREFVPLSAGSSTRTFDLSVANRDSRTLRIGDASTVTAVGIKDQTGTVTETVLSTDYTLMPRTRQAWEPITALSFPSGSLIPATLTAGYTVDVTGTWGFPAVPDDVRVAVARMVLVRYVTSTAPSGSALADALNAQGFDLASSFAAAQEVKRLYSPPIVA